MDFSRDTWTLFQVSMPVEIKWGLSPGRFKSSLDKSVRFWDVRTGFSELLVNLTDTLPWDVKLWNGEKDLIVGCESGEIGIINFGN